ncbi:MAG: hypothetical protein IVW54_00640 [Candidatus Binataceae bacterium]|nr:hypothetical protein [Candidatus Binataceae bacterium]
MPAETAIAFLRTLERPREVPCVVLISGPHHFLREYVLDRVANSLREQQFKYRPFQIANSEDAAAALQELSEPDLFAARRVIVCRILKSVREIAANDEGRGAAGRGKAAGIEAALIEASDVASKGGNRLVMVYERDNAPAKIRREVEKNGLVINCMRPFDNQIGQYAGLFARLAGCRLAPDAADRLAADFASDLGGIANAIAKAQIGQSDGQPTGGTLKASDFAGDSSGRAPELFQISEAVSRGDVLAALGMLDRAMGVGRDALEILGVELVPTLRRMMLAAALLRKGKSASGVAAALGMPPGSHLAAQAVDGARRYGGGLSRAYQAAIGLDASIKSGLVSETREALARLLIDLIGQPVAG